MADIYRRNVEKLSRLFVETIRNLSAQGRQLNATTLMQSLVARDEVRYLLDPDWRDPTEIAAGGDRDEVAQLMTRIEKLEEDRKKLSREIMDLDIRNNRETDFNKRFTLTLLRLARTPENEPFTESLDQYRDLVADSADLERREAALRDLKNLILKTDVQSSEDESGVASSMVRGLFKKVGIATPGDTLAQIKKASFKALDELHVLLGNEYGDVISDIQNRIRESDDVDYLISQRKKILSLIEQYMRNVQSEKERVTGFLREVGEKLTALETEIDTSSDATTGNHDRDLKFNDDIEARIEDVRISIANADSFDSLKSIVSSKLDHITTVLHEKRAEYLDRIERARGEREKLKQQFQTVIGKVYEKNRTLEKQSRLDPLTGIYNRRVFEERIQQELDRFQRYGNPFSIIFFDVDHFKRINDSCGHEAGDKVLKAIARRCADILRKSDVFARYGGEEFVALIPEGDGEKSISVARKLREAIETTEFEYEGTRVPVTISIGLTTATPRDRAFASVVNRADAYMYEAKKRGRNTIVSDADDPWNA